MTLRVSSHSISGTAIVEKPYARSGHKIVVVADRDIQVHQITACAPIVPIIKSLASRRIHHLRLWILKKDPSPYLPTWYGYASQQINARTSPAGA